jgi:hypothetical protein
MQNKQTCFILAAAAIAFTAASPAHAQVSRTWVSGLGDDLSANCARTAPCKTFAGAISKTLAGGEINCLDPAGYGPLTITKSITVDCHDVMGHVLASSGATGITINLDAAPNMIVRLRNINFNGLLAGTKGISIIGTSGNANNNAVSIEDCVIDGFTQDGISHTAIAGRLLVRNTVVRNHFGSGVAIVSAMGASAVKATLDNVSTFDSGFGFAFGNGVQAAIKNSVSSGHTTAGVELDPSAVVTISSSTILGNGTGILANAGATVRVRDSDVAFNTAGFSGTIQSHVNNSFFNNGAGGTIVPVAGGVTNPQGLQ